jgi:small conductance mechanosensitive channel
VKNNNNDARRFFMEDGLNIANSLYEWLVNNGMELAKDILTAVIILAVAKVFISIAAKGLHKVLSRSGKVSEILEKFTINITRKALWIISAVIIIGQFGIDIGPLIAGLGVTGFVLGFAFQETIGNLLAGVMISLNKPFGLNEYVDIGGIAGTVKDMDMISITLHTPDNKKIVMANKVAWGKPIINFSAFGTRRVDMMFGISYGSDIRQAREIIRGEIEKIEEIRNEPAPLIEVLSMSDSSVDFTVRMWVETANYWKVFYAMNQNIKYAFDEAGIEIPFPQVDLHLRREEAAAVVNEM